MGSGSIMPRFFISRQNIVGNTITVEGDDAKHITLSLRARPGEKYTLCDCNGTDYLCTFVSADKNAAVFEINEAIQNPSEPDIDVTLYMALVKADKFEAVIQKSVELGVKKIVPVLTRRCISRPDEKGAKSKLERWNKISREAAGQCGRGCVPEILQVTDFKDALTHMQNDGLCFMCYENEKQTSLKSLLESAQTKSISFMVGPEGGFDEGEVILANNFGIESVSLGKRILRAETAPLSVLSAVMYHTGNLG